jgi:hypothetical protein
VRANPLDTPGVDHLGLHLDSAPAQSQTTPHSTRDEVPPYFCSIAGTVASLAFLPPSGGRERGGGDLQCN